MPGSPLLRLEVAVTPARRELVAVRLLAAGARGAWELPERLVVWFPASGEDPTRPPPGTLARLAELARQLPELSDPRFEVEPDRDWQAEWKAGIGPVHAGRFVVVPSWLVDDHPGTDATIPLVLDPGRAFGSGHHATTTMCLELLDGLDSIWGLAGRRVADVGCGSGVLAIAAALLGATVEAVDVDPTAVEVTRENAERNRVDVRAATGSVQALGAPAGLVLANLVSDVLVRLAAPLVEATREHLVVSGIAVERRDRVLDVLGAHGVGTIEVRERDGWVAAHLRRTDAAPGGPHPPEIRDQEPG